MCMAIFSREMIMQQHATDTNSNINQILISGKEVQRITSLSRPTIYIQMAQGKFPQSISIGDRRVAWILSEVQDWCAQKIKNARAI